MPLDERRPGQKPKSRAVARVTQRNATFAAAPPTTWLPGHRQVSRHQPKVRCSTRQRQTDVQSIALCEPIALASHFDNTAVVAGPAGASPMPASAGIPLLSILWFGPCGAFFRPGRLIQKPARAAAVKDGRRPTSPLAHRFHAILDRREHAGTLARHGNARSQSSPPPINCIARKHIKIRDPA
jgi:hypothetical protein